ncbi:MAG: PBP1A family penicillin-binding protein [Deltaproteobacteria bacterium]|nr:PBP1A family penicillin-binding protein [Deltaproteobacteria bacterium]
MLRKLFWFFFILLIFAGLAGGAFLTWGYYRVTRDLPKLSRIEDYRPPAVSTVYAADGTPIAEFYEERRYPVKIADVPDIVIKSFLAAEDANFFSHPGIDFISILRAFYKNLQAGSARQGGSTITQQVVKNLLLSSERSLERKIKEAILSYRLEKRFKKEEILEIYLNQIYFGNSAYGIKAAARLYFHKDLKDLTLGESSLLAGLPKAPSRYSPIENFQYAKQRQRYVLRQMAEAGFITKSQSEEAYGEKLSVYPASTQNIYHAPYFTTEVRRILKSEKRWSNLDIDRDGLQIYTTVDLGADKLAAVALRKGLREVDKRRGWRGPLAHIPRADKQEFLRQFPAVTDREPQADEIVPAMVTEITATKARVDFGPQSAVIDLKEAAWARKLLDPKDQTRWINPEQVMKRGDVVEISLHTAGSADKQKSEQNSALLEKKYQLDQTPQLEGALVLIDPHSGRVTALQGGYDFSRNKFNRATQGLRQPGSTFKPFIYLAAVDGFKFTPATIVHDSPQTFRVGETFWTPGNFDGKFLGPITLRTALEKSRNLISAEIVAGIGVDAVIRYAKLLGIESPLGRNLSLSLGSSEVTLLELTRAYGVFAAKGILFDTVLISRIVDRDGNEIYNVDDQKLSRANQVISDNSAFIMANMLKGVVEHGTGYRVKEIKRPAAGKTGTSNDQMDAWFVGFTPNWACGVWVGFDEKKEIGEKETGGAVAAPIWLYFMRDFLNLQDALLMDSLEREGRAEAERLGIEYVPPQALEPLDFQVPEGVDPYWVDKASGLLSTAGSPGAFYEYFMRGTEPKSSIEQPLQQPNTYLQSPDL